MWASSLDAFLSGWEWSLLRWGRRGDVSICLYFLPDMTTSSRQEVENPCSECIGANRKRCETWPTIADIFQLQHPRLIGFKFSISWRCFLCFELNLVFVIMNSFWWKSTLFEVCTQIGLYGYSHWHEQARLPHFIQVGRIEYMRVKYHLCRQKLLPALYTFSSL